MHSIYICMLKCNFQLTFFVVCTFLFYPIINTYKYNKNKTIYIYKSTKGVYWVLTW